MLGPTGRKAEMENKEHLNSLENHCLNGRSGYFEVNKYVEFKHQPIWELSFFTLHSSKTFVSKRFLSPTDPFREAFKYS